MKIRLSDQVIKKFPGLNVAVIVIKNLNNQRRSSMIAQLLRGVCASKKFQLKKEEQKENLKNILNPTLSEGSILLESTLLDSFIKKVIKGTEIKSENNLMDISHHLILKYLVPTHGSDLDQIGKDLEIDFIIPKKGKKIPGLNFTQETRNIALWIVNVGGYDKESFENIALDFAKTIQKYCSGLLDDIYYLNADNLEADLNYISERELHPEDFEEMAQSAEKKVKKAGGSESLVEKKPKPQVQKSTEPEESIVQKSLLEPTENKAFAFEPTLKDLIQEELKKTVQTAFSGNEEIAAKLQNLQIEIETPREAGHGDYASNIALKLSKILNQGGEEIKQNPHEIAEKIQQKLPALDFIEKTEIAGPGFINFHISQKYLQQQLQNILDYKENYGRIALGKGQKAFVDFSSPNIAKPLGVHHLLSTLIGQTLINILKFASFDVTGANYLGDWGTQFGKLIYAYKNWGDKAIIEKDPLNELLKLYVRFHDEVEKEQVASQAEAQNGSPVISDLEEKGREEFKKLEEGETENRQIWEWIREISIKELERLYQKMGVKFDEYLPESMYEEGMKEVLKIGKEKGIFVEGERGAYIVNFDDLQPYLVQKADGTTLYSTRDLASMKDRILRFHPSKLIYVVDVAQSLHFKQLFATAKKMGEAGVEGFTVPVDLVHVVFGRMQFPEGGMSTRKGNIILLDELIKEGEEKAQKIVDEKSIELIPAEKKAIAEGVAIGAIKYQIISQNRETNMTFEWDRMLSLDGNSAPYLQYTLARAISIVRKAEEKTFVPVNDGPQTNIFAMTKNEIAAKVEHSHTEPSQIEEKIYGHAAEKALLRAFIKFPEAIEMAAKTYKPNLVSNYLYELAQIFNSFYQEVSVLNTLNENIRNSRLDLVKGFIQVLKNGLSILGIPTFEKM